MRKFEQFNAKVVGDYLGEEWVVRATEFDQVLYENIDLRKNMIEARKLITDLLEYAECNDPGNPHIGRAKGFLGGDDEKA